jgi:RNA polymerase sigma factor (sigma-70 family)
MMAPIASATGTQFAPRVPLVLYRLGDERLARLVAIGHDRAFAMLYERYHQPLYRYVRSMLGHDADAQDAVQSAFASAFGALKVGRRNAPVRPWLFRIAHNEAISALRRRRPRDELTDTLASPEPSPEEQVIERARLQLLVADLAELTDRQRGALIMRELSGLSHEDIACALEMSVGAAKQTVFEARRALLELEEGRAMACEEIQRVISDGDMRVLRGRKVHAHLRSCSGCAAFAAAIQSRRTDLLALSPALPAAAAAGIFGQIVGAAPGHGGGGGGLVAGLTGKATGVAISAKTVTAGVAVLAATTIGTAGVLREVNARPHASDGQIARSIAPGSQHGASAGTAATGTPAGVRPGGSSSGFRGHAPSTRAGQSALTTSGTANAGGASGRMVSPSVGRAEPGGVVTQPAAAHGVAGRRQALGQSTSLSHGRGSGASTRRAATHGSRVSSRHAAGSASKRAAARPEAASGSRGVRRRSPRVPVTTSRPGAGTPGASGAASVRGASSRTVQP